MSFLYRLDVGFYAVVGLLVPVAIVAQLSQLSTGTVPSFFVENRQVPCTQCRWAPQWHGWTTLGCSRQPIAWRRTKTQKHATLEAPRPVIKAATATTRGRACREPLTVVLTLAEGLITGLPGNEPERERRRSIIRHVQEGVTRQGAVEQGGSMPLLALGLPVREALQPTTLMKPSFGPFGTSLVLGGFKGLELDVRSKTCDCLIVHSLIFPNRGFLYRVLMVAQVGNAQTTQNSRRPPARRPRRPSRSLEQMPGVLTKIMWYAFIYMKLFFVGKTYAFYLCCVCLNKHDNDSYQTCILLI